MRWFNGITASMGMSLSKLWEVVKERKLGILQSMGSQSLSWLRNWTAKSDHLLKLPVPWEPLVKATALWFQTQGYRKQDKETAVLFLKEICIFAAKNRSVDLELKQNQKNNPDLLYAFRIWGRISLFLLHNSLKEFPTARFPLFRVQEVDLELLEWPIHLYFYCYHNYYTINWLI